MKVIHSIIVVFLSLNIIACGAGSTAGDLGVYDLSVGDSDEMDSELDDPGISQAGVVTLSWTPPTENTDMTGLNDLEGYNIYYGIRPDQLIFLLEIGSNLSTYVIENDQRLQTGTTYYFGIKAFNASRVEGVMSNIVSKNL